ncbi:MAG: guanylate kinase [Pseudoflavonifractor sp.]|nr:guanylate kinase [Alloprevotella sp.]MCM1116604.1 guanylate kinase [Pseudoflavonifractor sp.]
MEGKIIIISAPSGSGKSTIIHQLMERGNVEMEFSVSATNRPPRGQEQDGVDYHFLSTDEFNDAIAHDRFVEYEEVYPGRFYGTLRSEIENRCRQGHNVILDIDVKGGVNVKRIFGPRAISIFIQPPSIDELKRRLEQRATDSPEAIAQRVGKAEYELSFAKDFDHTVVNQDLSTAVSDTESLILSFLRQ